MAQLTLLVALLMAGFGSSAFSQPNVDIRQVSRVPLLNVGRALSSALRDSILYVATFDAYHLIDVSDPSTPVALTSILPGGESVQVAGNLALFSNFNLYDVTNPRNPTYIRSIGRAVSYHPYLFTGNRVYIGEDERLAIYAFDENYERELIGSIPGYFESICVSDNGILIAQASNSDLTRFYDISDIENIVLADIIHIVGWSLQTLGNDYWLVRSESEYSDFRFFYCFDQSNPRDVRLSARILAPFGTYNFVVRDTLIYAVSGDGNLHAIGISDPGRENRLSSVQLPIWGGRPALTVGDDLAAVSNQTGVFLIDVSDPRRMELRSRINKSGRGLDIVKTGEILIVLNAPFLHTIGIEDPLNPTEPHFCNLGGRGDGFVGLASDADGNVFVVRASTPDIRFRHLYSIRFDDPQTYEILDSLALPNEASRIRIDNGIAYITAKYSVAVCDVREPDNLRLVSEQDTRFGNSSNILFQPRGGIGFLAETYGYAVYDISNPDDFRMIGMNFENARYSGINSFTYLVPLLLVGRGPSAYWPGIYCLDITDVENMVHIGGVSGPVHQIAPAGNRIVATAEDTSGVRVFHVTEEGQLWQTGRYNTPGRAEAILADGNLLYVADRYSVEILDISDAQRVPQDDQSTIPSLWEVSAAYPNPFNGTTAVTITLAKPSLVRMRMLDVSGKSVMKLCDGALSDGSHQITIPAKGLSTGVYFIESRVDGAKHLQSVVLMR
ncbi:MAG: T9SS type A sorting domain-containing protein [Calditrichaeota bacterium]|nr:T9SS type A sorting domain-containing protein [Calditrichota bacterium]